MDLYIIQCPIGELNPNNLFLMKMTRGNRAVLNSLSRFAYEIVAVICSFILPRLILSYYGSDINGLVLSITRFLSISTFIDAAIGGVTRAAMYKPLAEKNWPLLSRIYHASNVYYRNISRIFLAYTLLIACLLPFINGDGFGYSEIFWLTLAIAVSTYIQFLIGATNNVLVYADQKVYLISIINTITIILNTIASVILIKLGCGIHLVKLTTSVIFAVRPLFTYFYCKSHYPLSNSTTNDSNLIPNKWSGFSHQIAETVHNNADVLLLTALSIYANVSIYAIYTLITDGLTKLLECLRSGMGPGFGNMLVSETSEHVRARFSMFEWVMNVGSCILFSCSIALLIPFVMIYTENVTDANYNQPIFAILIILSTLLHNMKNPYLIIIFAAGHFKQTQKSAYIEMTIHLICSVIFVTIWGLNGVALGTIIAMLYRVIYCAKYLERKIIFYSSSNVIKKMLINVVVMFAIYYLFCYQYVILPKDYYEWVVYALEVFVVTSMITLSIYSFLFRADASSFMKFITALAKIKQ